MLELLLQSRLKRRRRTRVVQLLYRLWECRMSLQATQKTLPDAPARPARARPPSSAQSRWGKKREQRKLHRLTWRGLVVKTELVKRLPSTVALQTHEQHKTVTDEVLQNLESRSIHTADMSSCTDLPRHSFYVYPPLQPHSHTRRTVHCASGADGMSEAGSGREGGQGASVHHRGSLQLQKDTHVVVAVGRRRRQGKVAGSKPVSTSFRRLCPLGCQRGAGPRRSLLVVLKVHVVC